MEFIQAVLEQQPLMALFLTIAIGYVVGEVNIKGFSLGVGAVLFVALGMGWFAPKSAPAAMLGNVRPRALPLHGRHPVREAVLHRPDERPRAEGQPGGADRRAGLGRRQPAVHQDRRVSKTGYALGLFAGSGTSTPTLQAAIATLGNDDPAVGYSVAYPFGVAGPILFLYLAFLVPEAQNRRARGLGHGVARDRLAKRRSISASGWAS